MWAKELEYGNASCIVCRIVCVSLLLYYSLLIFANVIFSSLLLFRYDYCLSLILLWMHRKNRVIRYTFVFFFFCLCFLSLPSLLSPQSTNIKIWMCLLWLFFGMNMRFSVVDEQEKKKKIVGERRKKFKQFREVQTEGQQFEILCHLFYAGIPFFPSRFTQIFMCMLNIVCFGDTLRAPIVHKFSIWFSPKWPQGKICAHSYLVLVEFFLSVSFFSLAHFALGSSVSFFASCTFESHIKF